MTTRPPEAARNADAYVAAVPFPFEPTTVRTGTSAPESPIRRSSHRARSRLRRDPSGRDRQSAKKAQSAEKALSEFTAQAYAAPEQPLRAPQKDPASRSTKLTE
ncbi:hypothetical protein GCM10010160_02730 [Acrocarpospora corrugata]